MKKFFKYSLATFTGTLVGLIIFFLILAGIIAGIAASNSSPKLEVKPKSVLLLRLKEPISETRVGGLRVEANELVAIFNASRNTARKNRDDGSE